MANSCGECGVCCSVMEVKALKKRAGVLCGHFTGAGCGVYESRPQECRRFLCAYLTFGDLPERWRPDRCGFMMWSDGDPARLLLEVLPDREGAWREPPFYNALKAWTSRRERGTVMVRDHGRMTVVFPEADIDLGPARVGQVACGYREEEGVMRPFAHYV